jgi:hypothetical protein
MTEADTVARVIQIALDLRRCCSNPSRSDSYQEYLTIRKQTIAQYGDQYAVLIDVYHSLTQCTPSDGTVTNIYNPTGGVAVENNPSSTNVNTGGGAIVGSAFGSSTVWANTIQSTSNVVKNSSGVSQDVTSQFQSALEALEKNTELDDGDKTDIADDLKKIAELLPKKEAEKSRARRLWDNCLKVVVDAGKSIPELVALGATLAKWFGWT